ncbi:hypothetical protein [Beijerinckia indica]|uniref:Putative general secretion pathway protein H n=1 Tax=Beijerinckia indica subsp. indica (strain ATCC 9039 / DSM 1715 / NCIMB 8712) TaxID=395963 RepID=B2IBD1_BEII9|nr:hypothetical protein [Beijerinckia indica]ACB95215.1 putative general secretion pathway protein H precursor [Beijerinckia indica subsp. indica ATCC 9039]
MVDEKAETLRHEARAGFVLLEIVAALAIAGLLFALILPWVAQRTSTLPLEALLARSAATLRDTRSAAIEAGRPAAARFDPNRRQLSGTRDTVTFPVDLAIDMTAGNGCDTQGATLTLIFQPDGQNCGAILKFQQARRVVRLRVNGTTGAVDIQRGEADARQ